MHFDVSTNGAWFINPQRMRDCYSTHLFLCVYVCVT